MKPSPLAEVEQLEKWYLQAARKLPWRETLDPYSIWISEVMLQQTQVASAIGYYERFLKQFPTLESLAQAPLDQVLTLWSGLGYYSRARNLHRGAQYLVEKHGGKFPQNPEEVLKIPSVGPYTRGAICSIAWDQPIAIVDGNVERVFSRFYCWPEPLGTSDSKRFFWKKAEEWVGLAGSPRILNQALMELGSQVCTPKGPACSRCCLRASCSAWQRGVVSQFPLPKKRRKVEQLFWGSLLILSEAGILLTRRKKGEWWNGLYDLPRLEAKGREEVGIRIQTFLKRARVEGIPIGTFSHTVTHHKIEAEAYLLFWKNKELPFEGEWVPIDLASRVPQSSLFKKIRNHVSFDKIKHGTHSSFDLTTLRSIGSRRQAARRRGQQPPLQLEADFTRGKPTPR